MSLFLVMSGGAIGAGARHLVGRATFSAGFPTATLLVNVIGGLLMGCLVGSLARSASGESWRLFLGVGVLGGFTTFSAFSLDAVMLAQRGQIVAAGGYIIASVTGSIVALVVGLALTGAAT